MKTRFRAKSCLFRQPVLILQVLDTRRITDPFTCDTDDFEYWRDARAEDFPAGYFREMAK